ncbi:uncharacterized protein [Palaemon carinicauda]|uniref:uncharacterized protein n=1 Tax=Palaemon carinicauda TaxID=392227 RepID=UPI0035B61120
MGGSMCRFTSQRGRKRKRLEAAVETLVSYKAKENDESYPTDRPYSPEELPTCRLEAKISIPLLKCTRCSGTYSDFRIPRNLSCGHSLCTACIEKDLPDKMICLECNEKQNTGDIYNFPVNYQLLRLSRSTNIEEMHIPGKMTLMSIAEEPFSDSLLKVCNCNVHNSPLALFCCTCNVWICQDCLVLDHVIPPRGVCKVIGIAEALERIRTKYGQTASHILKEIEDVKRKFEFEIQIHDICLKHCSKERSHVRLIEEIESLLAGKREENELEVIQAKARWQKLTDSAHEATLDVGQLTQCCNDLLVFQEDLKAVVVMERRRLSAAMHPMLKHWRLDLKKLAEGRQPVYALLEENEVCRWADVAVRDNRLLLYSLNEGKPPAGGVTVPYEYAKKLILSSEPTIYLEMKVAEENVSGRVYVRLTWDCPSVRQMLLMCSGEKGISLKNTGFFKYDRESGLLSGGDYENNDGTGGTPIISGLADEDEPCTTYHDRLKIGALLGEKTSTKFHFNFKVAEDELPYTIGYVSAGLKVLKAVIKLDLVSETVIKDCGVCIPMNPPQDDCD